MFGYSIPEDEQTPGDRLVQRLTSQQYNLAVVQHPGQPGGGVQGAQALGSWIGYVFSRLR